MIETLEYSPAAIASFFALFEPQKPLVAEVKIGRISFILNNLHIIRASRTRKMSQNHQEITKNRRFALRLKTALCRTPQRIYR
jgi:hypothetical protein